MSHSERVARPVTRQPPRSAPQHLHIRVGGVPVFNGGMEGATKSCAALIESRVGGRVATANLDFLALARKNPQLRADLDDCTLVAADGMPVVWLSRLLGAREVERVPGVDLVPAVLRAATRRMPVRVVLYGAEPGVARSAADHLASLAPGAMIAGVISPPFRALAPEEQLAYVRQIAELEPNVVLVALGCPAQERLIAEWSPAVPSALWFGIGGTFDLLSGKRKRAPAWIQAMGLEWAFRMAQEPGRLGRRYLGRDIPALFALGWQCFVERANGSGSH